MWNVWRMKEDVSATPECYMTSIASNWLFVLVFVVVVFVFCPRAVSRMKGDVSATPVCCMSSIASSELFVVVICCCCLCFFPSSSFLCRKKSSYVECLADEGRRCLWSRAAVRTINNVLIHSFPSLPGGRAPSPHPRPPPPAPRQPLTG